MVTDITNFEGALPADLMLNSQGPGLGKSGTKIGWDILLRTQPRIAARRNKRIIQRVHVGIGKSPAGETLHRDSIATEGSGVHDRAAGSRRQENFIEPGVGVDRKSAAHNQAFIKTRIEGKAQARFDIRPEVI